MTAPRVYIDPPKVEPYRYGLFGAAQPLTDVDGHWLIGGVEWESLASYMAATYPAGAFTLTDAGGRRTKALPDSMPIVNGWPFAVYAGVDCGSIGRAPADFLDRAADILALARQHAVEDALWTGGGVPRTTALNATGASTVLTGTEAAPVAVSVTKGIALCEKWIGNKYNGRALLHAPRDVAPYASRHRHVHRDPENADAITTALGTRWVFGGGYNGTGPNGQTAGTDKAWIYVTGQVFLGQSDVVKPSAFAEVLDRTYNKEFAIAEQAHLLGIDGPWAAALVDFTITT